MRNKNNIYLNDLHGYDNLYRFIDIYPNFEVFVEKTNANLYFHQLTEGSAEYIVIEKMFKTMFNKYKNNFFRWKKISTIYNEMGLHIESLLQASEVFQEFEKELHNLVGTTSTTSTYKTDNTTNEDDPEVSQRYRTSVDETFTDNGLEYMDKRDNSIKIVALIQKGIKDMKYMFMNQTDENVYNIINNRG